MQKVSIIKFNIIKHCFLVLLFSCFLACPVFAYSLTGTGGASKIANKAGYTQTSISNPASFLAAKASTVIAGILSFLGAIFLILMIYSGYMWMTARGNDTQVTKARTIMTQAVVGLVIVITAYAITIFIGTFIKF